MDSVDIVIVGAGVVGLATAWRLAGDGHEVVVVEKHDGFGREASSRNSEVIHAGLYYPRDTLKAILCVEGNRSLYSLCEEHGIECRKTGKILVANTDDEETKVHQLHAQGEGNGVEGLRLLTREEVAGLEPHVDARMGLYSPETGVVDSHGLMAFFEKQSEARGATVAYRCETVGIEKINDGYEVTVRDADGETMGIGTRVVVNAAGLCADRVAELAGINVELAEYRIHPCKGEYFRVANRHKGKLSRLVYPAPTPISLGVHAVLGLDGSLRLGPNAFYVDSCDYDVDESHAEEFYTGAKSFLPFLEPQDLSPDQSGIRAKLQRPGDTFRDFVIQEESSRGLPGFINLVGIESPGLTSSPAIAGRVAGMLAEFL